MTPEGHGGRFSGLAQTEDDAEGQGGRFNGLAETEEDTEGQGSRWSLAPVGDEDAEGNVLQSHVLEIEKDENGELVGRYVPEDDDTEGNAGRYNG